MWLCITFKMSNFNFCHFLHWNYVLIVLSVLLLPLLPLLRVPRRVVFSRPCSDFAFLSLSLFLFLWSVEHGQRAAEKSRWVSCKRKVKNILLTLRPLGFISQAPERRTTFCVLCIAFSGNFYLGLACATPISAPVCVLVDLILYC